MVILWGRDLCMLYNDAYAAILADEHPAALGKPGSEVWGAAWATLEPMLAAAIQGGAATWSSDQRLCLRRRGFCEEIYLTGDGESGGVGGVLASVMEMTDRVLEQRRAATLLELAACVATVRAPEDVCRVAAATIGRLTADVPWALLYMIVESSARLVAVSGIDRSYPVAAASLGLSDEVWPFARGLASGEMEVRGALRAAYGDLPGGPWPETPDRATVLPIPSADPRQPFGFLVAATSLRLAIDARYRVFLSRPARHVGIALANAIAYDHERKRADDTIRALTDELRLQMGDMERLHETIVQLGRSSLDALLAGIVDAAIALCGADMGSIHLCDTHGRLRLAAQRGFREPCLQALHTAAPDETTACGAALAERVVIEDVARSALLLEGDADILLAAGVHAVQSTPLLGRSGAVLGVLSTHYRKVHRASERTLRLLDLIARPAADLVERAQAERALRESEERLRLATQAGKVGIWDWEIARHHITSTESLSAIHGVPEGALDGAPEGVLALGASGRSRPHPRRDAARGRGGRALRRGAA
jgi:GAF domain-containing protein